MKQQVKTVLLKTAGTLILAAAVPLGIAAAILMAIGLVFGGIFLLWIMMVVHGILLLDTKWD